MRIAKMKKGISAVVCTLLLVVNANATGIPTVDMAAVIQSVISYIEQLGEYAETASRYQEQIEQWERERERWSGLIHGVEDNNATVLREHEMREMYDKLKALEDGIQDNIPYELRQAMDKATIYDDCEDISDGYLRDRCYVDFGSKVVGAKSINKTRETLNEYYRNIEKLKAERSSTSEPIEVMDLQLKAQIMNNEILNHHMERILISQQLAAQRAMEEAQKEQYIKEMNSRPNERLKADEGYVPIGSSKKR